MTVSAADYVVKLTGGLDQQLAGLTSAYERLTEMWTTDVEGGGGTAPMVSGLMMWLSVFQRRARGPRG